MEARLFIGAKQFLYLEIRLGHEHDYERTYQYLSYSLDNYNIIFNDTYVDNYIPDIILKKYSDGLTKTTALTSKNCLMLAKLSNEV